MTCGVNTGLYLTLYSGPYNLMAFFSYHTQSDPLTIIIEGSNQNGSALTVESSWTLIYHGTSGLNPYPGRFTMGTLIILPNVLMSFKSYRLLITSKRAVQTSTSCSEFVLIGY